MATNFFTSSQDKSYLNMGNKVVSSMALCCI